MRNSGSSLIVVAILVTLIGALSAAFQVASIANFRSSARSIAREGAVLAAHSGAAYYIKHVQIDPDYFATNPPPLAPLQIGDGSFEVESATLVGDNWKVVIVGTFGESTYRLGTTLGKPFIQVPTGLVVGGDGSPSSTVMLELRRDSLLASYDPSVGGFDPLTAGNFANLTVNGSARIAGLSTIQGNVSLTGALSGDPLNIAGLVTEGAAPHEVADIDPYVISVLTDSQAVNDNSQLYSIFGGMYTAQAPFEQNYGSLIVDDGGTYRIPQGTYRFKKLEVTKGSTVIFDTSSGVSNLVYIGSGTGTGRGNDLTVEEGSSLQIDPGGTQNGLLTVLGPDCDFKVSDSIYGQAIGDPDNAGYCQIVSLGGNFSSDDIMAEKLATVYGRVYAAGHLMTVRQGSTWFGSALVGEALINDSTLAIDVGTLGKNLQAKATNAQLLGFWDE